VRVLRCNRAEPERLSSHTVDKQRFALGDKYRPDGGPAVITGLQAIVRLLIEQRGSDAAEGLRTGTFVSGYQGSPLAALDSTLLGVRELLAQYDIKFVPGLNEELAATAVCGTQQPVVAPGARPPWDGVVGVWYGKAPGLDRVCDVLRHGNMLGAHPHGGVLALAGDDPGCKSSTLPSASESVFANLMMPVLYPRNAAELVRFGMLGVAMSRFSGCFVGIKIVADVADALWSVDGFRTSLAVRPDIVWDDARWTYSPQKLALPPHSLVAERELLGPRWLAVRRFIEANEINAVEGALDDAWIGIVAPGKTYGDVREALHALGLHDHDLVARGIRLLHLGAPFPLDRVALERFARGLEEIVVVEEKRSFVEAQIREALYSSARHPLIVGKHDQHGAALVPLDGELGVGRILPVLHARLSRRIELASPSPAAAEEPLGVARSVYFCSGCPHNRSTVVPEGSLASAGIGCHGMAALMPRVADHLTGITQMGGEGAQWIGQALFSDVNHLFQNMGDGTYFHSGQLAVQACIAAGINITFKILYNGAVSMTGGQDIVGVIDVPALARKLAEEGVRRIIVCADDLSRYPRATAWPEAVAVWHRDRLDEAQRVLRDVPGVTVLIYDQRCAAELRRLRKRHILPEPTTRVFINERVCEGCGDCGSKSNCLSVLPVETEFGRKRRIEQSSCNRDFTCLDGDCPSFVTVEVGQGSGAARTRSGPPDVPEPKCPAVAADRTYDIVFAGIGGTGVVTVNHVLATAAMADGFAVAGLDQTGLSQKAGPVTSHLRISVRADIEAMRVSPGGCDTYVAFDILTGSDGKLLELCNPSTTAATVSTTLTPTGPMVADRRLDFPRAQELRDRIRRHVRDQVVWVDASAAALALLGDTIAANFLLVGAAYQAGQIPVSAESIEWALRLNGVAAEMNVAAFRWGRVAVQDPAAFAAAVERKPRNGKASPDLVERRAAELTAYQGEHLARRYRRLVETVRDAERASGVSQTRLSDAIARQFYRLLAYKDEYEVARLYTSGEFAENLRAEFPQGRRLRYHLHPPILRSLGLKRKLKLGAWFTPALHLLRGLRFLRGTPLDPFGAMRIRRVERALAADFEAFFSSLNGDLERRYDTLAAIAEAAEIVCGYEDIKLQNVRTYLAELQRLGASAPKTAAALSAV
jgi:indolepyruvate ferredoxin oxidoreductase